MAFSRRAWKTPNERGFTLVELCMAMAMLGVGLGFIVMLFSNTWRLWKRSYDELLMQEGARTAMAFMTKALREGSPGTVNIDSQTGSPPLSRIAFTDGKGTTWTFKQDGYALRYYQSWTYGSSATTFLTGAVEMLSFVPPNMQDFGLIDVSLVCSSTPYTFAGSKTRIRMQLVERVILRNP